MPVTTGPFLTRSSEQPVSTQNLPRNWVGVVSREDVLRGVEGGFAMLDQGSLGPLLRLAPGDWLIYYSPRTSHPGGKALQAFTAIGTATDSEPYQADIRPGVTGFRRDMDWLPASEIRVADLSAQLDFTRGSWGLLTRRGLFEVTEQDRQLILNSMTEKK